MLSAALDVGTNTLRLIVQDTAKKEILFKKNFYLLLGSEVESGLLTEKGVNKIRFALEDIKKIHEKFGDLEIFAVATAFARSLKNPDDLLKPFKESLNCEVKIVDSKAEGEIVALALKEKFNLNDNFSIIDIGGGSTEFINVNSKVEVISLDFGSLFLTKKFFSSNPPKNVEKELFCTFINEKLADLKSKKLNKVIFGVGGTFTTLAFLLSGAKEYDSESINGFRLFINEIENFFTKIEFLSYEDILKTYTIEEGREKVLLGGVLEVLTIMHSLNIYEVTASDESLLEGIIPFSKKNVVSS